jgi:hypothetical protein
MYTLLTSSTCFGPHRIHRQEHYCSFCSHRFFLVSGVYSVHLVLVLGHISVSRSVLCGGVRAHYCITVSFGLQNWPWYSLITKAKQGSGSNSRKVQCTSQVTWVQRTHHNWGTTHLASNPEWTVTTSPWDNYENFAHGIVRKYLTCSRYNQHTKL